MFACSAQAQAQVSVDSVQEVLLWPTGAPGALGVEDVDRPSIIVHRPNSTVRKTGATTAVIIAPGGAYSGLAIDYEGHDVARWFTTLGVTAFVLKYRYGPRYHHPIELGDAQRAIRLVRARAREFNVAPDRIGIMGFSAGGHLAATAGTQFDSGMPSAADSVDHRSSRPDFLILAYPVISFQASVAGPAPLDAYAGSGGNLLGSTASPALLAQLSAELHVTAQTPPTFLYHGSADQLVSVENSVQFYLALCKAGVPAELHTFTNGNHGGGLNLDNPVLGVWPTLLQHWLQERGLLQ